MRVHKAAGILKLLSRSGGVTIDEMAKTAGWQPHSVRGFLSGHVRKKLGLTLSSEKNRRRTSPLPDHQVTRGERWQSLMQRTKRALSD